MSIDHDLIRRLVREKLAELAARRILENRDPEMADWREAGYATAEDAAFGLVGPCADDDLMRQIVARVAAELAREGERRVS